MGISSFLLYSATVRMKTRDSEAQLILRRIFIEIPNSGLLPIVNDAVEMHGEYSIISLYLYAMCVDAAWVN